MPTVPSSDLDCARLALLGLRAMIPIDALPSDRAYTLTSNGATISEQDLLTQLAAARKPVSCAARLATGTLEVSWQPLENLPHAFEFHKKCLDDISSQGSIMGFVVDRHGGTRESNRVLCAGAGESMVLPLDVVERWFADYDGFSMSYDDVDNPNASGDPLYQKARSRWVPMASFAFRHRAERT